MAAAGAALAALLVATTAAGSADDLGRAGRSLAYDCGEITGSHGPWAGSFYSLPLALVVGVGVLIAALALYRVVGRPRPQAEAGDLVPDDAERRRSATARTYRELETAGLVRSRRGGGTRVADRVATPPADERRRALDRHAAAYLR